MKLQKKEKTRFELLAQANNLLWKSWKKYKIDKENKSKFNRYLFLLDCCEKLKL